MTSFASTVDVGRAIVLLSETARQKLLRIEVTMEEHLSIKVASNTEALTPPRSVLFATHLRNATFA